MVEFKRAWSEAAGGSNSEASALRMSKLLAPPTAVQPKCQSEGCHRDARWALPGQPPTYCMKHCDSLITFYRVTARKSSVRCIHEGCEGEAKWGTPHSPSQEPTHCKAHKQDLIVHVQKRLAPRCASPGCQAVCKFGFERATHCRVHAEHNMVNWKAPTCAEPGCERGGTFRGEDPKGPRWCAHHRPANTNRAHRPCKQQGCHAYRKWGPEGGSKAEYCVNHRKEGMTQYFRLVRYRCTVCGGAPRWGFSSDKAIIACFRHKQPGMVRLTKQCADPDCRSRARFGLHEGGKTEDVTPVLCGAHCQPEKFQSLGMDAPGQIVEVVRLLQSNQEGASDPNMVGDHEGVVAPPPPGPRIASSRGGGGSGTNKVAKASQRAAEAEADLAAVQAAGASVAMCSRKDCSFPGIFRRPKGHKSKIWCRFHKGQDAILIDPAFTGIAQGAPLPPPPTAPSMYAQQGQQQGVVNVLQQQQPTGQPMNAPYPGPQPMVIGDAQGQKRPHDGEGMSMNAAAGVNNHMAGGQDGGQGEAKRRRVDEVGAAPTCQFPTCSDLVAHLDTVFCGRHLASVQGQTVEQGVAAVADIGTAACPPRTLYVVGANESSAVPHEGGVDVAANNVVPSTFARATNL